MYSFHRYLLNSYYVPGTTLSAIEVATNKKAQDLLSLSLEKYP